MAADYTHVKWDKLKRKDHFLRKLEKKLEFFKVDRSLLKELNLYFIASVTEGDKELRQIPTDLSRKSFQRLASLFETNQAYKDRVVQIQIGLTAKYKRLQRLKSVAEAYLYKTYGKQLGTLKSVDMRRVIVDDLLFSICKKIDAFDSIIETADLVKDNLHNTHFVLNSIKDMAEAFIEERKRSL